MVVVTEGDDKLTGYWFILVVASFRLLAASIGVVGTGATELICIFVVVVACGVFVVVELTSVFIVGVAVAVIWAGGVAVSDDMVLSLFMGVAFRLLVSVLLIKVAGLFIQINISLVSINF